MSILSRVKSFVIVQISMISEILTGIIAYV